MILIYIILLYRFVITLITIFYMTCLSNIVFEIDNLCHTSTLNMSMIIKYEISKVRCFCLFWVMFKYKSLDFDEESSTIKIQITGSHFTRFFQ